MGGDLNRFSWDCRQDLDGISRSDGETYIG
jgi:hypothetical protein